jgi:membrane protease YdiL (CAAX protease family)
MMFKNKSNQIWLFFGIVYLLSGIMYTPVITSGQGMALLRNKLLIAVITFIPSLLGVVFILLTKDKATKRDFWRRIFRWPKASLGTFLTILLVFPALNVIAYMMASFITGEPIQLSYATEVLQQFPLLVQFLLVEFFFGAVSEELGWRGYALDELQSRYSAFKSSLILGAIWAFWHTPAFLIPGLSQYEFGGIFSINYFCMMITVTAASILHTWSYNHTGRSILVSGILLHFVQNATMIFIAGIFDQYTMPSLYQPILTVLTIVTAGILVWRYGTQTLTSKPTHGSSQSPPFAYRAAK